MILREKVWKMIRGLIEFTYVEVAILTESPLSSVTTYLLTLYRAGYIRQAGKREDANGRRVNVWRLIRNTGSKAPFPCSCLYDPNIDGAVIASKAKQSQNDRLPRRSAPRNDEKPEAGHVD